MPGALEGQMRTLDGIYRLLQTAVWMLGIEPSFSARTMSTLPTEPSPASLVDLLPVYLLCGTSFLFLEPVTALVC